ncbi:MAG: hypothetical protein COW85_14165 [Ignavibacteria bacterium CG22_combo_CG10-13_8_21_14_all_37_15]|nr:MAG: hypothetical protein COW85_14165 [Ignavibacteria bacterium CG22_combo_CG10-13_8_21_14_all_37_15]
MKSRVFIKIVLLLIFQQLSFLHAQTVWGPFSCTNEKSFKQQTIGGGQPTYYWGVPYDYGNNKNGTTVVISRSVWSFTMPNFPQGAYVTKVEFKYKNVTDQNGDFNILHIPQNYIDPTSTYEQFWNISQNANSLLTCPGTTPNTAYTYEVPGLAQIVRDAKDAGGTIIYLGIRANPEGGTLGNVVLSAFSSVEVIFTFDIRAKYTIKNSFETGQVKINTQPQNSGFTDKFLTGISINLEAMEPQNSGNYEYLWNDTEALNNKSEWHIKQLNGIPVPKSINQSYSHPSSISEDNSLLIANLRRNFKITRNDQTEFDGTSGVADVTRIVDGNSGTVPADPTKTVGSRTYNFAGWATGGTGSFTPTDNMAYPNNAFYKTTHYSNQSSSFLNNNQNKVVKTSDGYLHLVYESMGYVFYERSTNSGTSWQLFIRVRTG